ncbi:MAG: AbrB/MazE/SpoVT family DNA-binding domain-containing protein [Opitutus sp.]|nr:AbrB/MazE/SpoVT family DNA-binding domain-containing protein [Opitutus sp.]
METTVTTKGQLTLPQEIRHALGIAAGTVLEVELGTKGSIVLRKKPTPGFFDQFVALQAADAPFRTGDAAREALRVAEDQGPYEAAPAAKKRRTTR